jgi:hypothetical protein
MSAQPKKHRRRGRPALKEPNYIACLDWNFGWHWDDVKLVQEMWENNDSGDDIADRVGRPAEEVAILIMDRVNKGYLHERPDGWYGRERRRRG